MWWTEFSCIRIFTLHTLLAENVGQNGRWGLAELSSDGVGSKCRRGRITGSIQWHYDGRLVCTRRCCSTWQRSDIPNFPTEMTKASLLTERAEQLPNCQTHEPRRYSHRSLTLVYSERWNEVNLSSITRHTLSNTHPHTSSHPHIRARSRLAHICHISKWCENVISRQWTSVGHRRQQSSRTTSSNWSPAELSMCGCFWLSNRLHTDTHTHM